ncbi:MAG: DMP19 family protein [Planctomycetota bacterium]
MTLEACLADLAHADPERRLQAAQALAERCLAEPAPPFEAVLARLKAQVAFGPEREPEPAVARAISAAVQALAVARGERLGFRIARPESLDALPDARLTWRVIEPLWDATTIYRDRPALRATLDLATPGQRALYALWWWSSEVRNGGLHQFLANSTGILAPEVRDGLARVGATEHAAIFRDLLALFPEGVCPGDRRERQELLYEIPDAALGVLDARFYALDDDVLFRPRLSTCAAHPDEFFLD